MLGIWKDTEEIEEEGKKRGKAVWKEKEAEPQSAFEVAIEEEAVGPFAKVQIRRSECDGNMEYLQKQDSTKVIQGEFPFVLP